MFSSCVGRCVAAGVLVAMALLPCRAGIVAVKPAPSTPAAEAAGRDLVLTIEARRRLLKDRELAPFNVGVRVRDRVALLWGAVPSAELALKAETCVRGMFELVEVRSELFVSGELSSAKPVIPMLPAPEVHPTLPVLAPSAIPGLPAPLPAKRPMIAPPVEEEPEAPPMRLPKNPG